MAVRPNLVTVLRRRVVAAVSVLLLSAASASVGFGQTTYYWQNSGTAANDWGALGNWTTSSTSSVVPGSLPSSTTNVIFNVTTLADPQTISLNADRSVRGATFTSGSAVTLLGGGATRILTLGAGGLSKTGVGPVTIGGTAAADIVTITLGTSQSWNNNAAGTLSIVNNVTLGTFTLTGTGSGLTSLQGVVSGSGSVVKNGSGTMILAGTNTFSGGVTVSGGTLAISSGTGTGAVGGSTSGFGTGQVAINSGGTVFLHLNATNSGTFTNGWRLNGGTLHVQDGATTFSGTIAVAAASTIQGFYTDTQTFSGTVSGAGNLLFQQAPGSSSVPTFVLSGSNTITGTITAGAATTLQVSNSTGLGATSGRTVVSAGGSLDLVNVTIGAEPVSISGTGVSATQAALNASTGASSLSGPVTLQADATVGGNGQLTLSGSIAGGFALRKIGTGLTILSGTNPYSGLTSVSNGTLRLSNTAAAGSNATIVVENEENSASSQTNSLQLSGGLTYGAGRTLILRNNSTSNISNNRAALDNQSGDNTWAGTIQLDQGLNQTLSSASGLLTISGSVIQSATASTALFIRGNSNGLVTGQIDIGSAQLYKTDGGTWTIASGTNRHGQFVIGNGTLVVAANDALDPTSSWTLGEGNTNNTVVRIDPGFTQSFAAISTAATSNGSHTISGSGVLSTGTTSKTLTVNNGSAADDLAISTGILGSGTLVRTGAGTLLLSGTSITAPLSLNGGTTRGIFSAATVAVNAGATLMPADTLTTGTLTFGSLAFGSGTQSLLYTVGNSATDLIAVTGNNALTTSGGTAAFTFSTSGALTTGSTYPLISYVGTSPGLGGFSIAAMPTRATGSLIDTGSAIALSVTDGGRVVWTGSTSGIWNTGGVANFDLVSTDAATTFLAGDDTLFDDTGVTTAVTVSGTVQPAALVFDNSAVNYTINGGPIAGFGVMPLAKLGTGTVTLSGTAAHTYTGATTISAGELAVNSGSSPLSATSGVGVASGATLRLFSANQAFTFSRNLTGSGTVVFDGNAGGTPASVALAMTGSNSGFSGTVVIASSGTAPANGTNRLSVASPTALGTGAVIVEEGGQLFLNTSAGPWTNPLTLSGYGYQETAGATAVTSATSAAGVAIPVPAGAYSGNSGLGALRLDASGVATGPVTIVGTTKITSYNTTGTLEGTITNSSPTDDLVVAGGGASATVVFAGDASGLDRIWLNGGSTAGTQLLVIGTVTGTTGSLGSGDVILYADAGTPQLRFQRADGYTLAAGQNITAAYSSVANMSKPSVQVNTRGTGLGVGTAGVNTIDLLDVSGTIGGSINVVTATAANGAILTIGPSATVRTRYFTLGETANNTFGTVNQTGGSVVLGGAADSSTYNLRIGHYPSGSGTNFYNLSSGTITFSMPGTATTPSAGSEAAGGIYIGVDGLGVLNQSGGEVNTNWVVLDNRGATGGNDQYNLSGGTLSLASQWGVIARNASAEFNWSGGTIRNSGTALAVAINAPITLAGNATLDTVSSGNTIVLMNSVSGSGTITTAGSGTVQLNPDSSTTRTGVSTGSGSQTISVDLAGNASVVKVGTGTTTLSGMNTYTGPTTISAGRLVVSGSATSSAFTVAPGAVIFGDGAVGDLTFAPGAGVLPFDPNTPAALAAANLTTTSSTLTVSFAAQPVAPGPYSVLAYSGAFSGSMGDFLLSGSAPYRQAVFTDTGAAISLDIGNLPLVWSGTGGSVWNTAGSADWQDANVAEQFYTGDLVVFDDTGSAASPVALSGTVQPWGLTVSSTTNNYTIQASTGNAIGGTVALLKTGPSILTMSGTTGNSFTAGTTIRGGSIRVENATSLGSGTIQLGDAGTGSDSVSLYLQTNRSIVATPILVSASATGLATLGSAWSGAASGATNGFSSIRLERNVVFDSNADDRTDYTNITGTGSITVTGSGRTIFNSTAGFVGDVTVSPAGNGNLQVGVATSGNQNYVPDAAIVTVNPVAGSTYGQFRLSAGGETIGALAGSGVVDVNSINGTLTVGGGNVSGTFAGTLQNFGANTLALTKSGTGIQALSGTGLQTGTTTIAADGGILRILSATALSGSSTVSVSKTGFQGGTLQLAVAGTSVITAPFASFGSANPATIGGTPAIENVVGDTTLTRNLTINSTGGSGLAIESEGGLLTLSGTLSNTVASSNRPFVLGGAGNGVVSGAVVNSTGNTGLNKIGAGTWSVTGTANTFSGGVTILEGVLDVASLADTGTASSIGSGGTILLTGQGTAGTLRYAGSSNQSTNRTLQIDPTGGTIESSGAGTLTFTGGVSAAESTTFAAQSLTFTSGSNVVFNRSAVTPGTVVGQRFTSPAVSGTVTITAIDGNAYTIDAPATVSTATTATFVGATDRTLTLAGSNTGRNTLAGALGDSAAGGRLGIAKTGAGTWVLAGANTYTGPTTVSAGSFVVNGSIGASAVTILPGATLFGSGTIGGRTVIAGTHSPGNSPGIETFTADLVYATLSTFVWELSANTDLEVDRGILYDGVNLTSGSLSIANGAAMSLVFTAPLASGSASTVDFSNSFWDVNREWKAIGLTAPATWDGSLFSALQVGADSTGAMLFEKRPEAGFVLASKPDGVYVQYLLAVPEPTAAVLGVVGAAGCMLLECRRRRRPRGRGGDRHGPATWPR